MEKWRITLENYSKQFDTYKIEISSATHIKVAIAYAWGSDKARTRKNAQLIAAAPDLLEILEELLKEYKALEKIAFEKERLPGKDPVELKAEEIIRVLRS